METICGTGSWKLVFRREAEGAVILRASTCDAKAALPDTLLGLPVSTTHAKTAAILGVGSAFGQTDGRRVGREIVLTWMLTFPGCGLMGFFLSRLFRMAG